MVKMKEKCKFTKSEVSEFSRLLDFANSIEEVFEGRINLKKLGKLYEKLRCLK